MSQPKFRAPGKRQLANIAPERSASIGVVFGKPCFLGNTTVLRYALRCGATLGVLLFIAATMAVLQYAYAMSDGF